jgi:5-methylcytosine-specific restriction endonuclease McrA
LRFRDQGCRFPGCDRPPAWTDGHHIIHWADGGPTELENLVSLCRPHHRAVHEQRWRIHIADGRAVVEPPP